MGMFLLTLQKISVSLTFIVTEIWPGQKHKFKKCFFFLFGQNFQFFFAKLNFDFFVAQFQYVCYFWIFYFYFFFARKVLRDMARTRKALQTSGQTDG